MERYPVAYIRRSYADATSSGDVSREVQEQAIADLAQRDGEARRVELFVDWGRSGSEAKSASRTAYQTMLRHIEAKEVSTVYAYAMDRLNRSLVMSARFAKACEANDVRIVTYREGEVRHDSPAEWLRWTILATFGEYELRNITARNTQAIAQRRSQGGWIGRVGYGFRLERNADGVVVRVPDPSRPLEPILRAVRDAGSILGGAKALQRAGVPAPDGGAVWGSTTLRRIVEDNAPELLPKAGPSGRRQPSRSSMLAQLLRCHCGHVLTPEPARKAYRCRIGVRQGHEVHGLGHVSEASLLPWIEAEAARHDLEAVLEHDADPEVRPALEASMARLTTAYVAGGIAEDDYLSQLAEVKRTIAQLEAEDDVAAIPAAIDWSWPAEAINVGLRALWRSVQLGPDMRPVSADWRVPEWRT